MKKIYFIIIGLFVCSFFCKAQTVTDIDGNIYNTVQIGNQTWMAENLATTKYKDGNPIPKVTDSIAWFGLSSPGYCWYKNDSSTYNRPWGALYNWYTVSTDKLCPAGWHVPSNAEWHTLVLFLDPAAQDCYCTESSVAGNELKETGLVHWGNGNSATNSSGFTAVGTGFRNYFNKSFQGHTAVDYFWTSTPNTPYATVWHRFIQNNSSNVYEYLDQKYQGMSVRCIKDSITAGMPMEYKEQQIKIYPNPAKEKIIFMYSDEMDITVTLYDILGQLLLKEDISEDHHEINVSGLPEGIYLIKITSADFSFEQKIIRN
jgi:uncharacterized protein (TIGR02145 family)